ncbi:hypothetical protein ABK040_013777 [Willaertia magna]
MIAFLLSLLAIGLSIYFFYLEYIRINNEKSSNNNIPNKVKEEENKIIEKQEKKKNEAVKEITKEIVKVHEEKKNESIKKEIITPPTKEEESPLEEEEEEHHNDEDSKELLQTIISQSLQTTKSHLLTDLINQEAEATASTVISVTPTKQTSLLDEEEEETITSYEEENDNRTSVDVDLLMESLKDDSSRESIEKIKKQLEKRENILNEILTTEEYYVKGLLIMDMIFRKPMKERKICDVKVIDTIFQSNNLDILIGVNQKFLNGLRELYENMKNLKHLEVLNQSQSLQSTTQSTQKNNNNAFSVTKATRGFGNNENDDNLNNQSFDNIGSLLNHFAHAFKLYSTYISGYKKSNALLTEERKKNKKLNNFLENQKKLLREQGERITQLEGYIVTPIQRIPRYRLLLEDLLKNTPEHDFNRPQLEEALELIKNIAKYINEAELKVENIQITSHMVHKLKLKGFIKPSRYLIVYFSEENDNTLCYKTSTNKTANCEVYVFSDVLVVHKRFDSFIKSKIEVFSLRKGMTLNKKELTDLKMNDKEDLNEIHLQFIYKNNDKKELTIYCKERDNYLKLQKAISSAVSFTPTASSPVL